VTSGFERLVERDVHQAHVWRVVTAEFRAPDGRRFVRDLVRSPGAVGVVPIVESSEPHVVLLHQWRPSVERRVWEIPAGLRDVPGEPEATTAQRELKEEAGYEASELTLLTRMLPSPGLTDSVTTVFLGRGLTPVPPARSGPEEDDLEVALIALDEAIRMIDRGEITDAKTVVGLLLAARHVGGDDTGAPER
jgi:ADP-ribose pyrophosphatase